MSPVAWIIVGCIALIVAVLVGRAIARRHAVAANIDTRRQDIGIDEARQRFQIRREWLEAEFVSLASRSGKPRGLDWVDCNFEDCVSLAREKQTGHLRALVGVTISFEAVAGGGMEDNPNVGNLREATAVFRFDGERWSTDGRAIFNLNPIEAIQHFQNELETVD